MAMSSAATAWLERLKVRAPRPRLRNPTAILMAMWWPYCKPDDAPTAAAAAAVALGGAATLVGASLRANPAMRLSLGVHNSFATASHAHIDSDARWHMHLAS